VNERAEGFWWVRWVNQGPDWEPALFKGGRLYSFLGCGSSVSIESAEGRLDWQPPIVEWGPYLGTEPLPLIEPPRPQMGDALGQSVERTLAEYRARCRESQEHELTKAVLRVALAGDLAEAQTRARRMADWAPHMRDLVAGVEVAEPETLESIDLKIADMMAVRLPNFGGAPGAAGVTVIDPDDVLRRDERAKERERIADWLREHEDDDQYQHEVTCVCGDWNTERDVPSVEKLAAAIEAMGDEQ
jgi:hypothetical protein